MRVAVISGGRSSEHDVSLRSGASVGEGLREAGHEVGRGPDRARRRAGSPTASRRRRSSPARGLLGCDAAFPVLHGPGGEDGSVQGAAGGARRPLRRLRRRGLGALPRQARLQAPAGLARASRRWTSCDGRRGRLARARRGVRPAGLGEARAARLERRDHQGRRAEGLDAAVEARPPPRPAGDRRGARRRQAEVECSVLGNAELTGLGPGRDRRPRRLVRLRGEVRGRRDGAARPGADQRAAAERVRELAGGSSGSAAARGLARCDFFVDGETCSSTSSTRSPASPRPASTESCSRQRDPLPGALRPPGQAGAGAARARRARYEF